MAYLPGSVTLSRAAWGIARQLSGVESQHPLVHVPFVPLEDDEGRRTADAGLAELNATWVVRGRQLHRAFIDVLRLLAAPAREVHGWIGLHNRSEIAVVSATNGELGISVAADAARVYLDPIDPARLVDSVIELLPKYPPSSTRSISVPKDFYLRATGGGRARQSAGGYLVGVQQSAGPARDVGALQTLLAGGRRGGGRFYVAARDRMGRRHKSEAPLTYLDLDSGRVLFREQHNSGGEPWLVASPATATSLAADLNTLLDQLF